ncbi:MAG: sigma-70 family RNA polymerase sigma factor [Clostridia bacterium]|nr:sigma-70 family RNA polymerase sigma factor [Clostridia bacterium]
MNGVRGIDIGRDATPEEIWRANEEYVRRICRYRLCGHPDEADDAVQDVGTAFFAAVAAGTEIREPKKWLTVVTANTVNAVFRRLSAESERFVPDPETVLPFVPAPEEPEPVSENDLLRCREAFLATLSEDEMELFRLRFVKGMKLKRIAEKTGVSENSVKQRIFRLKGKAKRFAREWAEEDL